MTRATITRAISVSAAGAGTTLSAAAASLAAGQCVKLATLGASGAFSGADVTGNGDQIIQWGNTGWYDATSKRAGWIGKRASVAQYWHLSYDEAANQWSMSVPSWSGSSESGHGYDHSAHDPATGTVYHRKYNDPAVKVRSAAGTWSTLPNMGSAEVVGGLAWFPGVGLIYCDGRSVQRYNGSAWSTIHSLGGDSYHDVAEYNATANVVILGGGNSSPLRKLTSGLALSTIASPPFAIGAAKTQGVLVADPGSNKMLAYNKNSGAFAQYDIAGNSWASLSRSSGSGASPQTGLPPLAADVEQSVIAIQIAAYNVTMWLQYRGSGSTPMDIWLYKHS
jgi:hypothetical protein